MQHSPPNICRFSQPHIWGQEIKRPCPCYHSRWRLWRPSPTAASFNVSGHFVLAVLINPVFLYFVGGGGGGEWVAVGAYQMQNSTPAVPKHPQWVQISAPLLLVEYAAATKGCQFFFFITTLLNLALHIFEWFLLWTIRKYSPESIDYYDQNLSVWLMEHNKGPLLSADFIISLWWSIRAGKRCAVETRRTRRGLHKAVVSHLLLMSLPRTAGFCQSEWIMKMLAGLVNPSL